MFENTPSDRMQLAGLGDLVHPACCMVCGNGTNREGYVHLGVWFEYEGTMYLCTKCLVQAAEIIGCLEPGEARHVRELNESLAETVANISKELDEARGTIDAYARILGNATTVGTTDGGPLSDAVSKDFGPATDPVHALTNAGESEPAESVKVQRRGNAARAKSGDASAVGQSGLSL